MREGRFDSDIHPYVPKMVVDPESDDSYTVDLREVMGRIQRERDLLRERKGQDSQPLDEDVLRYLASQDIRLRSVGASSSHYDADGAGTRQPRSAAPPQRAVASTPQPPPHQVGFFLGEDVGQIDFSYHHIVYGTDNKVLALVFDRQYQGISPWFPPVGRRVVANAPSVSKYPLLVTPTKYRFILYNYMICVLDVEEVLDERYMDSGQEEPQEVHDGVDTATGSPENGGVIESD